MCTCAQDCVVSLGTGVTDGCECTAKWVLGTDPRFSIKVTSDHSRCSNSLYVIHSITGEVS